MHFEYQEVTISFVSCDDNKGVLFIWYFSSKNTVSGINIPVIEGGNFCHLVIDQIIHTVK